MSLAKVAIGTTPKVEVARIGKARLFRYKPLVANRETGPLLIVHGLVGRHTIVDLLPDRSVVADMLAKGVDVWVIDWGDPGREDMHLGLHDYIDLFLHAFVQRIVAQTGAPKVSLFGICEGGIFALIYAALYPALVANLVLTITPADAHADQGGKEGFLNLWLRALSEDDIALMVDAHGNLPGGMMGAAFQAMEPVRALAKWSVDLAKFAGDKAKRTRFAAMETWLNDRPDHPGALAKEMLIGLYKRNDLVAGRMEVAGRVVDLSAVRVPVLNIYALRDHIVPAPCAAGLGAVLGMDDYTEMPLDAGHVGIFVSDRFRGIVGGEVAHWLGKRRPSRT